MGVGTDALVLSSDYWQLIPEQFTYVIIEAWNKLSLTNNATSCPTGVAKIYRPAPSSNNRDIFAVQPVIHYNVAPSFTGTTNPVYLVNTRDTVISGQAQNAYRVWRIRNVTGPSAPNELQWTDVAGSFQYMTPPSARQPDEPNLLDTRDPRVAMASGASNALWLAHNTSCQSGGGPNESCIRVVRINAGQDGSGNPTASITQQTVFGGGADVYYWWPAIALNKNHRTSVVFLSSSPTQYESSAWTAKNASTSSYTIFNPITSGTCARTAGNPVRTGDYLGAQTTPGDFLTFWLTAEHAAPSLSEGCRWATTVISVQ